MTARACMLVLLSLGAAGATWYMGTGTRGAWASPFLLGYAAAWACYVIAGVLASRGRLPRWALIWIVVAAVGLRVVALERAPRVSTDVYRYFWDGRVANAGINPYRYPPDAPEVAHLRDANWRWINFKHIPTIYPPTAEMLFARLARANDADMDSFRWTFALFDVGSVLLLIALLRRTGRPPERVVWYAWCPLAVTETTAGAHVDAVGVFLLLLAFLLVSRKVGKPGVLSGIALAASAMSKGYALLAAPLFVRRGGWRVAGAFVVTCALLLLPYLGAGMQLFGGLRAYLGAWETNSSIFLLVDRLLESATDNHFGWARALTIGVVLLIVAALAQRQKPGLEPLIGASFAAIGAQIFIGAPTLPWYVIWLVPALCFWSIPGIVLFTLTVSAHYYGRWLFPGDEPSRYALLWAGYVPVYALLVGQLIWRRLRR